MNKKSIDAFMFDVSVTVTAKKKPVFTYYESGSSKPLSEKERQVVITGPSVIFYKLINLELAPKGLQFIGAGFTKPFTQIVENSYVSENGDTLVLEDLCVDDGATSFHLLLKTDENNLIMISPDPEVINKGKHIN